MPRDCAAVHSSHTWLQLWSLHEPCHPLRVKGVFICFDWMLACAFQVRYILCGSIA
jgi:hypothetical protein